MFRKGLVADTNLERRFDPVAADMLNLRDLVEKTPDAVLLREMIGFAAERLMDVEMSAATGAA